MTTAAHPDEVWDLFRSRFIARFGVDPHSDIHLVLFQLGLETLRSIPKHLDKEEKVRVMDLGLVSLMVVLGMARWTGWEGYFPTYELDKSKVRANAPKIDIIREGLMRRYSFLLDDTSGGEG